MNILIIDVETTGLDHATAKVVEIAGVLVDSERRLIVAERSSLVNPGVLIPPDARSAHHISDYDVHDKPVFEEAMALLVGDLAPFTPCAHYAEYDSGFFKEYGWGEWICTMRCAKHVWPDAPSYSNQTLRYYVPELDHFANMGGRAMPPHRAGPDAWVTAHLVIAMLKERSAEELLVLTKTPVLLKKVGFGKHFGLEWKAVPRDYLKWLLNKGDFDMDVMHTARHWS